MSQSSRLFASASSQSSNPQSFNGTVVQFVSKLQHPGAEVSLTLSCPFLPPLLIERGRRKRNFFPLPVGRKAESLSCGTHWVCKTLNPEKASASHLPSRTRMQLSPALAPAAEDVFYSLLPWESSHCSHCAPSQTLSFHFVTLVLEKKSCCFSR